MMKTLWSGPNNKQWGALGLSASIMMVLQSEGGFYCPKFLVEKAGIMMILLSLIVTLIMADCDFKTNPKAHTLLTACLVMFLMCAIIMFLTDSFILFYVFFEFSIIPMMFLVSSSGYSLERALAMMYMYVYTVVFSLPALLASSFLIFYTGAPMLFSQAPHTEQLCKSPLLTSLVVLMFVMKMPIWGFHFWLPKAHVEASVQGSMLLASVVLKFGVYGLVKVVSLGLVLTHEDQSHGLLVGLSAMGVILMSFLCMRQVDNKAAVAMSSIVHMGPCLLLIFSASNMCLEATALIMLAHGLVSPAMFLFIHKVYETNKSRSMILSSGVLKANMAAQTFWFLVCCTNMGLPITMNFMGEVKFFYLIYSFNVAIFALLLLGILISGLYNVLLFNFLNSKAPADNTLTVSLPQTLKKATAVVLISVLFYIVMDIEL